MNSLILPAMGSIVPQPSFFSLPPSPPKKRMGLAPVNSSHEGWYTIKQRNQTKILETMYVWNNSMYETITTHNCCKFALTHLKTKLPTNNSLKNLLCLTVCKKMTEDRLLVLRRNTYNHFTVCKQWDLAWLNCYRRTIGLQIVYIYYIFVWIVFGIK